MDDTANLPISNPAPDSVNEAVLAPVVPESENTAPSMEDTMLAAYKKTQGEEAAPVTAAPAAAPVKEQPAPEKEAALPEGTDPAEKLPVVGRLSDHDKAVLATGSPEVQELFLRREAALTADYTRKTQDLAARGKEYDALDKIFEPRRQALAMNGMTKDTAVEQLFALSDFAGRDPAGFIQYMANIHRIDLNNLTQSQQQEAGRYVDPEVAALKAEVAELRGFTTQQRAASEQVAATERTQTIEKFASEKDDKGQPLRPHFAAIQDDMVHEVALIRRQNPDLSNREVLQKAYDKAVWTNPTTREALMASREAKRIADEKARAVDAKKATAVNVRTNGLPEPGEPTMEDTMRAVYAKATAK